MTTIALVLWCKNENQYLDEWLSYHFALGVNHVYILDNRSQTPLVTTVGDWIGRGLVEVFTDDSTTQKRQCRAYAGQLESSRTAPVDGLY